MHRLKRMALVVGTVLALIGGGVAIAGPALADSENEIQQGCDSNAPYLGSAGYNYVTGDGTSIPVTITIGWQYVGGASSQCEDINVRPGVSSGYYWTEGIVKVRTYMCNSSGSCWHNAWRNCQGGCQAATDMVNGTQYQVHIANIGDEGWWVRLFD